MSVVSLRSVSFAWPGNPSYLFDDLSLDFERGKTACLIGPNGAGKTTLLELMLGWRRPGEGEVLVNQRPVGRIPGRERGQTMALVPQDERLPFSYDVLEYVLLGRAPYLPPLSSPGRTDARKAREVLERVGIAHLAHRAVPRLSGGEKRMVLIARALLQEPKILFLDEPGNHLDPANRERIITILRDLSSSGITLIMSSHEPDLVTRLADAVVLLHQGGVPEIGRSEDLLVPEKLSQLYKVRVRMVEAESRRIILWGD